MNTLDGILRTLIVIFGCIFIVRYATLYEEEYSQKLIDLYIHPMWRILLVLILIMAAVWCPMVSIVIAFLAFFYLSDMNTLLAPLSS
jgi:hypothetical protein